MVKTDKYCRACGSPVTPNTNFCANCGHKLNQFRCKRCGTAMGFIDKFCPDCGLGVNQKYEETKPESSGQIFLIEDEDGMMVTVPADKLDSWSAAQEQRGNEPELTENEQKLLDMMMKDLYGK